MRPFVLTHEPRGTSSTGTAVAEPAGVFGVRCDAGESRLPVVETTLRDARVAVWWMGVHGGAGEDTLEAVFAGSRAAGHRWRVAAPGLPRPHVVLVARTSARGLVAAQRAMRQLHEDQLVVSVLGLVWIADAPGRLPRALRDLQAVVSGGAPRVWSLPWVERWRLGELPSRSNSPREAERLLADLVVIKRGKDGMDVQ